MASFLNEQMDFILFFYGFAFVLLGFTSLAIARRLGQGKPWLMLAAFGFTHGLGEWLDMWALIVGDAPAFAGTRIALMAGSFVLLMEFARLEAAHIGSRVPGRWIYLPLVAMVGLAEAVGGHAAAGIVARYSLGFTAAMAASWVLAQHAKALPGAAKAFAISASAALALYAIATGIIVPPGSFWPANIINTAWFVSLTDIPIQLVRGVLACWMSASMWAVWGQQLAAEISSARFTTYLRLQFIWTLGALTAILVCGWLLTEFLGGIYRQNVQDAARSDIELLAGALAGETKAVEGMVRALAGSPSVLPLLTGGAPQDQKDAKSMLALDVEASGARRGFVVDKSGTEVATSDARPEPLNHGSSAYFRTAIAGEASYQFVVDPATGERNYYAGHPIRSAGEVLGAGVLIKSLQAFEDGLKQFDRPYFFINPDGIVLMTNRPELLLRPLWPLTSERRSSFERQFGRSPASPIMDREIEDSSWTNVDGTRNYARRRFADHTQWSLVILKPAREIFASRFLGIVITLLTMLMALIYIAGRRRWFQDDVQMARRLELQAARATAESATKAKSDFLADMSHELRTPLNGILGYAQVLEQDADLNAEQLIAVRTIKQSGMHLLALISDLLDLAQVEAGKFALQPTPVRLRGFLNGIADIIRLRAEDKGLIFICEAESDLPDLILADEKRLRQVLLNLLGNAVKFTDSGQVGLRVALLSRSETHATIAFSVWDTGIGMSENQIDIIFQPFEQVGEQKRRIGGTGLGLSITSKLIRLMGSEILVESTAGAGSLFRFELVMPIGGAEQMIGQGAISG